MKTFCMRGGMTTSTDTLLGGTDRFGRHFTTEAGERHRTERRRQRFRLWCLDAIGFITAMLIYWGVPVVLGTLISWGLSR
jgi:hypothetical protein